MSLENDVVEYDELRRRFPKFVKWCENLFYDFKSRVIIRENESFDGAVSCFLYTVDYRYSITVTNDYLGCFCHCRRPRPGESWTRMSDFPDGENNLRTLREIMNAILRNEILEVEDTLVPTLERRL